MGSSNSGEPAAAAAAAAAAVFVKAGVDVRTAAAVDAQDSRAAMHDAVASQLAAAAAASTSNGSSDSLYPSSSRNGSSNSSPDGSGNNTPYRRGGRSPADSSSSTPYSSGSSRPVAGFSSSSSSSSSSRRRPSPSPSSQGLVARWVNSTMASSSSGASLDPLSSLEDAPGPDFRGLFGPGWGPQAAVSEGQQQQSVQQWNMQGRDTSKCSSSSSSGGGGEAKRSSSRSQSGRLGRYERQPAPKEDQNYPD
jgi:hypothetical protein